MTNWRDVILNHFVPQVSKLTLVADPDSLLTEEKLALELRLRGFDLLEFNDPVAFRYAYESNYRSRWDRDVSTDRAVILRRPDSALEVLPYDLLQAGRKLTFDLGGLFPMLSYPIIEQLDRSLLDALFEAQQTSSSERMGDNATKDFILRHGFGIAAELIGNKVDLLRILLRLHYSTFSLPPLLSERLVHVLKGHDECHDWPLDEIVADESAFFAFLQERWPVFLDRLDGAGRAREDSHRYGLDYPGLVGLPFDHPDIRIYIDTLFVEGKLAPVDRPGVGVETPAWIRGGILEANASDVRISRLLERIESTPPTLDSRYTDWIACALKWAELGSLVRRHSGVSANPRIDQLGATLNGIFTHWLSAHYASLINLPPSNPAMLHQVTRRLARALEAAKDARVALIVVDGLALEQWVTLRPILQQQDRHLVLRESATFAWIPTLTSVSRQAVFAGKPPFYFPSSINTTHHEANLWRQFWEEVGVSRLDIGYRKGLGDGDPVAALETTLHPGKTQVIGLVVDKVDKIMHGMQLGAAGMHNQIEQWGRNGFLGTLIGYLLDHDFQVWLTADHGNIECRGRGCPAEGVIAEIRGERVRVYPTPELRARVAGRFRFAHEWQPVGLPSDYYPLLAGGRDAFVKENDTLVGHGGISIEEVIVPLVKFERRTR